MLGLAATGIVLHFVLPPGTGKSRVLWGLARHEWGDVHFWMAIAMAVGVLLHVALHWAWVVLTCSNLHKSDKPYVPERRTRVVAGILAVITVVALIAGFWWAAVDSVRPSTGGQENAASRPAHGARAEGGKQGGHPGDNSPSQIRGSMTLEEAATAAGLTLDAARQRLGLPADVPGTEKLGQLAKRLNLTMSDFRQRLGVSDPHE